MAFKCSSAPRTFDCTGEKTRSLGTVDRSGGEILHPQVVQAGGNYESQRDGDIGSNNSDEQSLEEDREQERRFTQLAYVGALRGNFTGTRYTTSVLRESVIGVMNGIANHHI